jgi:predicted nucleic acid-binding protein
VEIGIRNVLRQSSDVVLVPITQTVLELAARLRATINLKTPDATHAATALDGGCDHFVTNDPTFKRVPSLPVRVLSDLIPPTSLASIP